MTEDDVKKLTDVIVKLALEVRKGSKAIRDNPAVEISDVRGTLDRWDGMRDLIFKIRIQVQLALRESEEDYKDKMRLYLSGKESAVNARGLASYEERRAYYETQNLDEYGKHNRLEALHKLLMEFTFYLKEKERWLDAIRRDLREDQKREDFITNAEYEVDM
jgi:hypothetical protein